MSLQEEFELECLNEKLRVIAVILIHICEILENYDPAYTISDLRKAVKNLRG